MAGYDGYGMPAIDFRPLAQLGDVYSKAKNEQTLAGLGKDLAAGNIDYRRAAGVAAEAGQIPFALSLLKLGEEKEQQTAFQRDFAPLLTGGSQGQPAQPPAGAGVTAPPPMVAPPVRQAAPGSPNERVASAFGDVNAAIDSGAFDPQGANMPQRAALTQGAQPPPSPPQAPQPASVAQPAPRTNPLQNNIPALMAVMTHPGASAGQRKAAEIALTEAIKTPDNLKEYDFYTKQERAAGRPPLSLFEWSTKLKSAGVQGRAETAEQVEIGKGAGVRANESVAAAGKAATNLQQLNKIENLLSNVRQGKIEPTRLTIGAWAKSLGLPDGVAESLGLDPKGVGTAQAVNAFSKELALSHIGSGGIPANNFSDADRSFLVDIVPNLGLDPEGNKILIEAAKRVEKLKLQKGREWADYKKANPGSSFNDFEIEWASRLSEKNIFSDLKTKAENIAPSTPPPGQAASPYTRDELLREKERRSRQQ